MSPRGTNHWGHIARVLPQDKKMTRYGSTTTIMIIYNFVKCFLFPQYILYDYAVYRETGFPIRLCIDKLNNINLTTYTV